MWFNVQEKLPGQGTLYLVYGQAKLNDLGKIEVPFYRVCFFEVDKDGNPCWEIEKKKRGNQFQYRVTHWRTLPEKP